MDLLLASNSTAVGVCSEIFSAHYNNNCPPSERLLDCHLCSKHIYRTVRLEGHSLTHSTASTLHVLLLSKQQIANNDI